MKKLLWLVVCLMTMVVSANAQIKTPIDDMYWKKVSKEAKWQNDVEAERKIQKDIEKLRRESSFRASLDKREYYEFVKFMSPIEGVWHSVDSLSNIVIKIDLDSITLVEDKEMIVLRPNETKVHNKYSRERSEYVTYYEWVKIIGYDYKFCFDISYEFPKYTSLMELTIIFGKEDIFTGEPEKTRIYVLTRK